MTNKKIRSVIIREVLIVLVLVTSAISAIAVVFQMHNESQRRVEHLNSFASVLNKDQDGLLLQLLLRKSADLNFYFANLSSKFPQIDFCIDINPENSEINSKCNLEHQFSRSFVVLGNRNNVIWYDSDVVSWSMIVIKLLQNPTFYGGIITALIISIFLFIRLRFLISVPLSELKESINRIGVDDRSQQISSRINIAEWIEVQNSLQDLKEQVVRLKKAENYAGQLKVARQVAHDIRSPLSMLKIAAKVFTEIPDDKRQLMFTAVERIDEIVGELSADHAQRNSKPVCLSDLIKLVVSEKLVELKSYSKLSITTIESREFSQSQSIADSAKFKRILSNILNNSIEAMGEEGKINVRLSVADGQNCIEISDSGGGIEVNLIHSVQFGLSVGKQFGQGLGLSDAREALESWGGRLKLESAKGMGTIIYLILPVVSSGTRATLFGACLKSSDLISGN